MRSQHHSHIPCNHSRHFSPRPAGSRYRKPFDYRESVDDLAQDAADRLQRQLSHYAWFVRCGVQYAYHTEDREPTYLYLHVKRKDEAGRAYGLRVTAVLDEIAPTQGLFINPTRRSPVQVPRQWGNYTVRVRFVD